MQLATRYIVLAAELLQVHPTKARAEAPTELKKKPESQKLQTSSEYQYQSSRLSRCSLVHVIFQSFQPPGHIGG